MLIGLKDKKKRSPSLLFAFQEFFRQKKKKNRKKDLIFQESIFSIFGVKIEIIGLNFDAQESRMIKILKCNKLPIN